MKSLAVTIVLSCFGGTVLAYEQPKYEVIRTYEGFELRRYGSYIVAETIISGGFDKVGNEAFRILFKYISGHNRNETKISMTAPVNLTPVMKSGEKIPMTAPVIQVPNGRDQGEYAVRFIMPAQYTLETLPKPEDPRVRIREIPSRLLAARTYPGTWSEKRYRRNEAELLRDVATSGLTAVSKPIFARYNSPFTLWFLRRNEVLVEVKPPDQMVPTSSIQQPSTDRHGKA
jgi:hypothetical protein